MAASCNGYIKDSLELYKPEEGTGGNLSFEFEKVFRGFEKVPIVICQRYDIKPYLNKMELDLPPDVSETKPIKVEPLPAITNLLKECSVLLERQNLEELKKLYTTNWKENQLNNVKVKCNICQKRFISEKKLQYHQENKHKIFYTPETKSLKRVSFSDTVIIHEVKKYHRCQKCLKIFENDYLLESHMEQIHKKRRCYICFYCSKEFIHRKFFKVHIKLHCVSCGLLLPDKKQYLEHRRTTCKIVKKYECKTCHVILFHLMDLRDHSYEHSGSIFICDICKEKFETRHEIKHHIRLLHSKSPPNFMISALTNGIDRIYLSNCSKERFKDKELVEKHVSVFPDQETCAITDSKDFYFCDQCCEKFNTETEMLQHKWTHYLKSKENCKSSQAKLTPTMTYNVHDKLPPLLQPKIILEKVKLPVKKLEEPINCTVTNLNVNGQLKKPIIDPVTKRTIISRHQCEKCGKYLSSNYCLTRHMFVIHGVGKDAIDGVQCDVCEEMVWPKFQSHKCFRMRPNQHRPDEYRPDQHRPEQYRIDQYRTEQYRPDLFRPDQHRPDQHRLDQYRIDQFRTEQYRPDQYRLDQLRPDQYRLDQLRPDQYRIDQSIDLTHLDDDEDYLNSLDFEIPAPIVELTEYENMNMYGNGRRFDFNSDKDPSINNVKYKIVVQEVPIEFE